MKTALLRPAAKQDLSDAAVYYAQQGGEALGENLLRAALAALARIEAMPGIGSPLIGQRADLPGLRAWALKSFPMRWYYFERGTHLDVVRLLGDRQDIAAILSADPPST